MIHVFFLYKDAVLSGQIEFKAGKSKTKYTFTSGDILFLPANTVHSAKAITASEAYNTY